METMCGGCDYDTLAAVIEDALQQPDVKAIVIAMDSPGGTAVGAAETFARIQAIRAKTGKEVWAFCDTKACSAMYYLAAACDGIVCTVTASLGCVGSMLTIEDRSGQLAAQGVRRLTIKSASMKDIGNPDRPPTPGEISELQQRIDFLGALFKRDVLAGRGEVNPEVFAKGLTYFGDDAVKMGLADEVVPSIEDFVAKLEARFDTAAVASA
jgi:ClpP class serine protease